ncbi:unnamed protein product [Paramecium octaurelia]|uniref:CPL domain-containing protein n=1 Tax=Paramecium octaurelia TaxID=43137 RepID=A0A8S1VTZ0_PAROT|nr:unnamed protein product [Paramecium octaurelia]
MGKKRIVEENQNEEPEELQEVKAKADNKKQKKIAKNQNKISKDVDFISFLKEDIRFLIQHRNQENEQKQQKAEEVFTKIEGILYQIAQTKIGGRTIQLVIKCADQNVRQQMFSKLLNDKQFGELLQSKYGHYIGITMVRNMVPEFRNQFFEILFKNANHYVAQGDASIVLDRFLTREATTQQVNKVKALFQNHSEKIDNLAMKIIEKGIHNHLLSLQILKVALPNLVPEERQKVIEYFQQLENLDYLRHKDGVSIFCAILNVTDKKERKNFLKNIQTYMQQSQEHLHRNSQFYLALQKVIFTYDDTKQVNKSILQDILPEWLNSIHVFKIIQSIYQPKLRDDIKFDTIGLQNTVSLKDDEIRIKELQDYCFESILNSLQSSETSILLESNINQFICYFISYIIKYTQVQAVDFIKAQIKQLLYFKVDTIFSRDVEQNGNYWILTQPEAQRIAKCLIQQQLIAQGEFSDIINNYCLKIQSILISNLKVTLISKAIYLLLALIENTNLKDQVLVEIKKNKKWIDKLEKTQSLQILYKYI